MRVQNSDAAISLGESENKRGESALSGGSSSSAAERRTGQRKKGKRRDGLKQL